ncbi:MAG: alpha/beta hydrolase [Cyanobium sp.]
MRRRLLAPALGLSLLLAHPAVQAAENVVFVSGAFRRSIPVADLEHLAATGQARGLLQDVLRLSRQDPQAVSRLLNQSVKLPVVLVSRLLNTRIGEVLLQRLAQIVFPLNAASVGLPALRSAVVLGLVDNDKGLSALSFLRAYPSQELAVSLPALMGVMSKASSISDLVRFFSDSPLDGLRGESPAAGTPAAPSTSPQGAAPAPSTSAAPAP